MKFDQLPNNVPPKKEVVIGNQTSVNPPAANPREPRNTKERNKLAGWIKAVRRMPFERLGVTNLEGAVANRAGMKTLSLGSSSLEFREIQMGVDFVREIKRILKKRKESKKENLPVRVLDVGAGASTFLSQLKKQFGTRLEAHSVDIRRFSLERFPQKRGTEQHIHHIEGLSRKLPGNYFDMIVDNRGGMMYAQDRERGLNEVYAVLAPGASAFIFPKPRRNMRNIFNSAWITDWAKRNGANVELNKNERTKMGTTVVITKPERVPQR
ncbi:MAG: class I SAM-dependent methyltransferase [bacterium]|nr:class I SAM-dependent methyltransferase [bacterium]